jgi:hypothetical protein
MSTTYEYIPLTGPRTIRLLELHPGKGSDPVEVSLITKPLGNAPAFEAISYCWGDPSDRREVLCNGCLLSITTSLFTGLEHFRPRPLSHSDGDHAPSRVLWADAICINQFDMVERSAQVNLMPFIYSLARRVLIWLGPLSPPYSGVAVRSCIREVNAVVPAVNEIDAADLNAKAQALWCDANVLDTDFSPLVSLLARPWFRRRWVVQEVSLAREAVMCFGSIGETTGRSERYDEEIPWVEVAALTFRLETLGAERFIRQGIQQCVSRDELLSSNMLNISIHCLNAIYLVSLYRGRGTLMDAINVTATFDCSDPHDIIYSLLGLSFIGPTITPDYTADFGDMFREFALAMVVEGASLKVLSLAPHKLRPDCPAIKRPDELPSWVPDLRGPRAEALTAYSVLPQAFFAGGHGRPIVCVSENRKVLSCQGRLIDTVKGFAADWSEVFRLDPKLAHQGLPAWLQSCYRFVLGQSDGDNASAERIKAFARTMLCDMDSMRNRLSPESAASLPSHLQRLMDHVEQEKRNSEIDDSWSAWEDAAASHSINATISLACWAKILKFGVTDGDRFMRAPHASQAGDRICVLNGGEVPFIIRPTGRETYELVGECYVDGIMDGEALKMGSGVTAPYDTICLE